MAAAAARKEIKRLSFKVHKMHARMHICKTQRALSHTLRSIDRIFMTCRMRSLQAENQIKIIVQPYMSVYLSDDCFCSERPFIVLA